MEEDLPKETSKHHSLGKLRVVCFIVIISDHRSHPRDTSNTAEGQILRRAEVRIRFRQSLLNPAEEVETDAEADEESDERRQLRSKRVLRSAGSDRPLGSADICAYDSANGSPRVSFCFVHS